jgi:hypothetical protein
MERHGLAPAVKFEIGSSLHADTPAIHGFL